MSAGNWKWPGLPAAPADTTPATLPDDDILTTTFGPIEDYMTHISYTDRFDDAMNNVTQDRGAVYGHPLDDFNRVARIKDVLAECEDPEIRHVLEMIAVKMCRLIESPDHLDSFIDIGGYARTGCMVHDEREARNTCKTGVDRLMDGPPLVLGDSARTK